MFQLKQIVLTILVSKMMADNFDQNPDPQMITS